MSDWTRLRSRLKKKKIKYKRTRAKVSWANFSVSFPGVKMYFSNENQKCCGMRVLDIRVTTDMTNDIFDKWFR